MSLPLLHCILMGAAWPSFLALLAILVDIIRNRVIVSHYRCVFIGLLAVQIIIEMYQFLHVELVVRPRDYGFVPFYSPVSSSLLVKLLCIWERVVGTAVLFGLIVLAENRYTAFRFPTCYRRIWSFTSTLSHLGAQWAIPTFFFSPLLFTSVIPVSFAADNSTKGIVAVVEEDLAEADKAQSLCFSVISLVLTVTFLVLAAQQMRQQQHADCTFIVQDIAGERVHLITASFMALPLPFYVVAHFWNVVSSFLCGGLHDGGRVNGDLWYICATLPIIVHPWLILIGNPFIRGRFLSSIGLPTARPSKASTVPTPYPNSIYFTRGSVSPESSTDGC